MTVDVPLPSPQTTLVILLGASEWPYSPDFERSEAFANSAGALAEYFLDPHLFNLPRENLLNLFDSNQSPDDIDIEIGQFLDKRKSELSEFGTSARDLIIYFTGHGGFADGGSSLYLAIRRTRHVNRIASSIPIMSLAHTIKQKTRHLRRIVILDCCFAGAAFAVFQGQGPGQAAIAQTVEAFNVHSKGRGIPQKGTSLLCSSGSKVPSLTRPGERYTAFSEGLMHALNNGSQHQQGSMPLYTMSDLIEDFLQVNYGEEAPRPEVHSPDQSEGDVAAIPFFPNFAEIREQQAREQAEREEQLSMAVPIAEEVSEKAELKAELQTKDARKEAQISIWLTVKNTGRSSAANVKITLLHNEHFDLVGNDSFETEVIFPQEEITAEFTIRQHNTVLNLEFEIVYDDTDNITKIERFRDHLELTESQQEFRYIPNPYSTGTPTYDSKMFYGREEDMAFLKDNLARDVKSVIILYGQRRADYPKVWPFPTESLATKENTVKSALQANSHSLVEVSLLSAKCCCFCYLYGSTGQFTYVAKLSVGCGQTFG